MDGEQNSGSSIAEINEKNHLADKSSSNQFCSDDEKDFQDPSVKTFIPFSTFCKAVNMKNDNSVVKSDRNAEISGLEKHYSKIEDFSANNVVEDGSKPKSLAALFSIQNRDTYSSSSGHLTVSGGGLSTSSRYETMSFRSNSTTSTTSFAFPILASDWNGSPVRMADGDTRFLKKSRHWRMCFGCYNV